jgi:hypothetical protein
MFPRGDDSAVCEIRIPSDVFSDSEVEEDSGSLTTTKQESDFQFQEETFSLKVQVNEVIRTLEIEKPILLEADAVNGESGEVADTLSLDFDSSKQASPIAKFSRPKGGDKTILSAPDRALVEVEVRSSFADQYAQAVWCLIGYPWSQPSPQWRLGRKREVRKKKGLNLGNDPK